VKTVAFSGMFGLDVIVKTKRTSRALFSPLLAISCFAFTVRNTTFSIYHTVPPLRVRLNRERDVGVGAPGAEGNGKGEKGGGRGARCRERGTAASVPPDPHTLLHGVC
jgi:hypothetical protein